MTEAAHPVAAGAGTGSEPAGGRSSIVWTGGTYSLLRIGIALVAGAALFVRSSDAIAGGLGSTLALGLWIALGLIGLGYFDRWSALAVVAAGAALELAGPNGFSPAAWALVALFGLVAAVPPGPYLSLAAKGRVDPGGGWRMPAWIAAAAWGVQLAILCPAWNEQAPALAWVPFGLTGLLALTPRTRPFAWALALVLHVVATATDPEPLIRGAAGLGLLGFSFTPSWIGRRDGDGVEQVFYDGACGLCHGAVRFLLAEDPAGVLSFAPIAGDSFRESIPDDLQGRLPDSILVLTEKGELLDRSRAVVHTLSRLGGVWHVAAFFGEAVPLAVRDPLYDFIAKRRHRWFETPAEACPLLPPHLMERFRG